MVSVSELINEIGAKNVRVQFLEQAMVSSGDGKKATRVVFLTDTKTQEMLNENGKTALILWMDKKKLNKAFKKLKKNK